MFRSRIVRGAIVLIALTVPAGVVAASGDTEPPDSAPATTEMDDTEVDESGPPSASAPTTSEADDAAGMEPPVDIEFQIDMMLGLVPQDEMEEYWAQDSQDREREIQACMNESGFEYDPDNSQMTFSDPTADMPRLEYAELYGFGIWTTMDPDVDPYAAMGMDYEWPNQDIVDALSESEQNAWYEVNNRCSNEVYSNVENDPWRNPEVQQAMEDFQTDIENDPRMRDAQATWVDCMEAAGHPYPSEEEMWTDIQGDDEDWTLHDQFYQSEAWEPTSEDHAQWQELVDQEIEVAVANAGCSPDLEAAREEVTQDLREELIAVWQTIDWSLPPVTYEGEGDVFLMPGETLPDGTADAETTEPDGTADPTETTEAEVGLDLGGDPTETTEG